MRIDDAPPPLPPRDPRGHKGTFGTVAVVGGCAAGASRMIGAPALAAQAALRAGAGLVRIAAPAPIMDAVIGLAPSATGRPVPVDTAGDILPHEGAAVVDELVGAARALVVGPGLGRGDGPRAVTLRAVQQESVPVVIDADGLHALAETPELARDFRAAAVLTPHPGEFASLARVLGIRANATADADRPGAAEQLAQRLGAVVVLKGPGTVVSDGQRTWVNSTGNAALATAGTGDVLAGLISGLAAQWVRGSSGAGLSLFDAARVGVRAHGRAAELWCGANGASAGLVAVELADLIPRALAGP